jgi:REP element-mobilizing transposase RayT
MDKEKEYSTRKDPRLKGFDYNSVGAYFITICTQNRRKILSQVVGGDVLDAPQSVELLPCGIIADKIIKQLNNFYNNLSVMDYVIMPNHIHILLYVKPLYNGASRTSPPTRQHSTISQFVSTFKRFCNKEYGENIWQLSFYDHIIRNREDYENHEKYIHENPARWFYDELYSEE